MLRRFFPVVFRLFASGAVFGAEALPAAPPPAPKPDPFVLQSADGAYQLRLGGYMQLDGRFASVANQEDASSFLLRRVRPLMTGKLARVIQFRVMPDFGEGKTVLQDAWAAVRLSKSTMILGGRAKFRLDRSGCNPRPICRCSNDRSRTTSRRTVTWESR